MKYLRKANPVCQTHESFSWRTALGNTATYFFLSIFFIALGAILEDYGAARGVLIGLGIYFLIPCGVNVMLIIGLQKKNPRYMFYWVVYACLDGILLSIFVISAGIYGLVDKENDLQTAGIVAIIFGFLYYGSTYYIASIINTLRLKYLNAPMNKEGTL